MFNIMDIEYGTFGILSIGFGEIQQKTVGL
jgi:hypothetical protein